MIKRILAAALALSLVLALTACGGPSKDKDIDVAALADQMLAAIASQDELIEVKEDVMINFYEYDKDSIAAFKVYASATMSTADEVGVFKAADKDGLEYLETMLDYRVQTLRFNFEDYNAEEMPKIEKAKIIKSGLYIAFIVADDTAAAEKLFVDATK